MSHNLGKMKSIDSGRLEKIRSIEEQYKYKVDYFIPVDCISLEQIHSAKEKFLGSSLTVQGRVVNHRNSRMFIVIRDDLYELQLMIQKDSDFYSSRKFIDLGDTISASGLLNFTSSGELTLFCNTVRISSKCLVALPDQYFLPSQDINLLENRTYTLALNKKYFSILKARFHIISSIRKFMYANKYTEVDTPILQNLFGGALANPFTTHYDLYDETFYLRIAPELYLKRLIIAGYSKVFEIGKNFRNESRSTIHNPEFTTMECYTQNMNMSECIKLFENIFTFVVSSLNDYYSLNNLDMDIEKKHLHDISNRKWIFIDFNEKKKQILNNRDENKETFNEIVKEYGMQDCRYTGIEDLYEDVITKHFIKKLHKNDNIHLINHPIEISPLAKSYPDDNKTAMRFESYVNGVEVSNGFQENNDYFIQKEQFEIQHKLLGNKVDELYLQDMMLGMPATAGMGIGLDRLVMLLTNSDNLLSCLTFEK